MSKSESEHKEERERVVDSVVKNFMSKELLPKPPTELGQLRLAREDARNQVRAKLAPIVAEAKNYPVTHPFYIHSEQGRAALLETAVKLYVDALRKMSREEALFLLAFAYAELTLADYV